MRKIITIFAFIGNLLCNFEVYSTDIYVNTPNGVMDLFCIYINSYYDIDCAPNLIHFESQQLGDQVGTKVKIYKFNNEGPSKNCNLNIYAGYCNSNKNTFALPYLSNSLLQKYKDITIIIDQFDNGAATFGGYLCDSAPCPDTSQELTIKVKKRP